MFGTLRDILARAIECGQCDLNEIINSSGWRSKIATKFVLEHLCEFQDGLRRPGEVATVHVERMTARTSSQVGAAQ